MLDAVDGELENIRCLVHADSGREAAHRDMLRRLGARRRRPSLSADDAALEGKLLMNLGALEEASARLSAASGDGGLPLKAWLGQALLLRGEFASALAALDEAAARGPRYPWTYFFRAAAKLALDDQPGAAADCARFQKDYPGAGAPALAAVVSAKSGDFASARAEAQRAAELAPGEAWPRALQSLICRSAGDPAGSKAALTSALEAKPSAWLYAERAKAYEELGILPAAIADAAQAAEMCPCVEHHVLKAHLHSCWREGELAAAEYGKALALAPGDPSLLFQRSKVHSAAGDILSASRDAETAAALSPGDEALAVWAVQLQALSGRTARARGRLRGLAAAARSAGALAEIQFARAYVALLERDGASARAALRRCRELAGRGTLARKASFYEALAALDDGRPERGPVPDLSLIGMGVDPPYTATAESFRALRRCAVAFNNVMGDEMFEVLRPFCRDCRPLAYHQNNDEERLASLILSAIRPGRPVAFVTRGNAIVYGPLGALLMRRCRERGLSFRCLPAVSSQEHLGARFGGEAGASWGSGVLDSAELLARSDRPDPSLSLTLFMDMRVGREQYLALCRRLEEHYGKDRPCLVLDHVIGQEPLRRVTGELAGLRAGLSPSAIVHIPAKPEAAS